MKTILLISPFWKEDHRWMVSSYKLSELWQQLGYKVVAVTMSSETKVEVVSDTLTIHHLKDIFFPAPWNFGICFQYYRYVLRLLDEIKPDQVIINKILFWSSWTIIPLRFRGIKPLVLTDALVGMTYWPRPLIARVVMAIGAWTMGWLTMALSRTVVFFHPQPKKLLQVLQVEQKSQVIPTGIDASAFSISEDRFDIQNQKVTVSFIGRLEPIKGADDFLEAILPLQNDFPQLDVQVVGFYEQDNPIWNTYKDRVRFLGLRRDIPTVLSDVHIYVLPSYAEGLSNALMEAMSSGCSCIATNVGGNPYLLDNGNAGLLYAPGDRQQLQAHVRQLLTYPQLRVDNARKARKRIEEVFDWIHVKEAYKALLLDLED